MQDTTKSQYLVSVIRKKTVIQKNYDKHKSPIAAYGNDTILFKYKNTRDISMLITPLKSGKRELKFHKPIGEVSYRINDIKQSYTRITEANHIQDKGAVASINTPTT